MPLLKLTKIRSYVATMKARGFAPSAVLADSGLTESALHDPALLIEPRQREQVVRNMLRLTRDPGLGLEMGPRARLVDFGALGHAQITAPTLREVLSLWQRYSSVVGTTIPIELDEKSHANWRVIYHVGHTHEPAGRFDAEEITSMAVSIGHFMMGPGWQLAECTFSYRRPPHGHRYEMALGCPVRFSEPVTSVRVKGLSLDQPLSGHDPEFHQVCLRHLDQLVRQAGRARQTSERLRSLLMSRPVHPPSLDQAADYLGMGSRTLRRHLLLEHTSFGEQLNQLRLDLARRYLHDERMPVKQAALELGYRSVPAFRRAFRLWSGKGISEFMRELPP